MEVTEFIRRFPQRPFTKGEVLVSEGDQILDFFVPVKGYIKVTSIDDAGVEHLLWIAGGNDILPAEHLFTVQSAATYFYTALTSGIYHTVSKSKLLTYIQTSPSAMTVIADRISRLTDDLLQRIDASSQQTVRGKLLTTLYYLACHFSTTNECDLHHIGLPLTHLDLAEMIGATRETTSIELQHLRRNHLIDYSRSSFIIYKDRIATLVM